MNSKSAKPGCLAIFGALSLLFLVVVGTTQAQTIERSPLSKNAAPAGATLIIGPQPVPPVAPSLEQLPAVAPQVAFRGGQLTIVARNSSLGAILQDVQTQTGASIDMPSNPTERVVGQFGPGPPREVLASLLNGSHFNYVLLGSPQNPDALEKVVLLSKSSAPEEPAAAPQPVAAVPRQGVILIPNQDADDTSDGDNAEDMVEPAPDDQAQQANAQQNGMPNTVRSPQELLQELQRQQQALQASPQGTNMAPQRAPNDK